MGKGKRNKSRIPYDVRKCFKDKEFRKKVCDNLLKQPSIKLFVDYKKLGLDILKDIK